MAVIVPLPTRARTGSAVHYKSQNQASSKHTEKK